MNFQFIQPSLILRPYIKYYWVLEGTEISDKVCKQRIFPDDLIEIIFYYGEPYLKTGRDNKSEIQPFLQVTGQKKEYYDIQPTGKIGLLAVTFKPNAAKLFLNLPLNEIENCSVSLENISGSKIKVLEDLLFSCRDVSQRVSVIEKYLIQKLKESDQYDYKRINYSIEKLNESRGLLSIPELADIACLSPKQFNRKFLSFVGVSPKQFSKIVRFQNAIYLKQLNAPKNLTDLALQCGYYDQAHFTNEFKMFTGYTPKDFFKICQPFSDYFS